MSNALSTAWQESREMSKVCLAYGLSPIAELMWHRLRAECNHHNRLLCWDWGKWDEKFHMTAQTRQKALRELRDIGAIKTRKVLSRNIEVYVAHPSEVALQEAGSR